VSPTLMRTRRLPTRVAGASCLSTSCAPWWIFATGGLLPDRTILIDVPVEVGLARKSAAETTRWEAHFDRAFHERVRAGYLSFAAADPARWVVVDGTAPADDVFAALWDVLLDMPGLGPRLAR